MVDTNGNPSTAYDAALPTEFAGMERSPPVKPSLPSWTSWACWARSKDHVLQQPYGDRGGVPIEPC